MEFDVTLRSAERGVGDVTVHVDAPDSATLAQLAEALRPLQPSDGSLSLGDRPFDATPLLEAGPLHGAVIGIGGAAPPLPVPTAGPRAHVEAGPATGMVLPLGPGGASIGRDPGSSLSVPDPSLSRAHAAIAIDADGGWTIRDVGSRNGTLVGGREVGSAPVALAPEQPVSMGATALSVVLEPLAELSIVDEVDGSRVMTRPFRHVPALEPTTITVPRAPAQEEGHRTPIPWIALVVPLVMAAVMVKVTGRPQYALFAVMGPVMMLGTTMSSRRSGKRSGSRSRQQYEREMAEVRDEESLALRTEALHLRRAAPDPAAVTEICCGPGGRLWERRPSDNDFCRLWVGTGPLPSTSISYEGDGARRHAAPGLVDVPITIDLPSLGAVGLHGALSRTRAVARGLVLQLAALQGPDDLRIVLIPGDAAHGDWEWSRWLPHLRTDAGTVAAAVDSESVQARLQELSSVVEARKQAMAKTPGRSATFTPAFVAVVEEASGLRSSSAMSTLLSDGPAVGVWTICLERARARVPQECRAAIGADPEEGSGLGRLELKTAAPQDLNLGPVPVDVAEACARSLAPIRVADRASAGPDGLEGTVRLLDLIGYRDIDPDVIRGTWDAVGRSTRFAAGRTADGTFSLDLTTDGPHGLVAGTTGAGKSQFLMTLVTSLAFANTPEDLNFVLVDFKGGGAFEGCRDLPHTTGMVTNLAGGGAQRAIRSLRAEANRRQALFASYSGDIDVYEETRRRTPGLGLEKIPRLVIVVDEFAQLAKSNEELLKEFVDVAQVGRSLGMNMILATQRPAGVITGQIQSNTDLRIALRVAEAGDSMDVIGVPVAASIAKRHRGRAFIQTADGLAEVQTAAVGIPRPDIQHRRVEIGVRPVAWVDAVRPTPDEAASGPKPDPTDTDLFAAVQLIRKACELGGYTIPPAPFRPDLPALFDVAALGPPVPGAGGVPAVPIGLEDLPEVQEQRPYTWHPATGGLIVSGSQRSGRTSTLRCLVAQAAAVISPRDLHLYVLDHGGALRPFEELPHCGAVVSRSQPQRAARLVDRLEALVRTRTELLESLGVDSVVEQRERGLGAPLPFVVLAIDQWHAIWEKRVGAMSGVVDAVQRLARDGAAAGVSVVIAGDARSCAGLTREIAASVVLRQNTPGDVEYFGLRARDVPDDLPDGRAMRGGSGTFIQMGLLGGDAGGTAQSEAFAAVAGQARAAAADLGEGDLPFRIDELPGRITLDAALTLPAVEPAAGPRAFVGIGGDRLSTRWFSPAEHGPGFMISGPGGSGRSTALVAMARALRDAGVPVGVVAPGRSPLAHEPADVRLIDADALRPAAEVLAPVLARGGFVLVDDADTLQDDAGLAELLEHPGPGGLVVAGTPDWARGIRGFVAALARGRCGLVLTPHQPMQGSVLGLALRPDECFTEPAGRGYLNLGGRSVLVQVPEVALGGA